VRRFSGSKIGQLKRKSKTEGGAWLKREKKGLTKHQRREDLEREVGRAITFGEGNLGFP